MSWYVVGRGGVGGLATAVDLGERHDIKAQPIPAVLGMDN